MDPTMFLASSHLPVRERASEIDRFYEEHSGVQLRARLAALRARIAAFRLPARKAGLAIHRRVA